MYSSIIKRDLHSDDEHCLRRFIRGLTAENIGLRQMFTCNTLHRWVCKSRVTDYSSTLAILRSQSRDLPVLWRATPVSTHADWISIVIGAHEGYAESQMQLRYLSFHHDYCLIIWLQLIVLPAISIRNWRNRKAKLCEFMFLFNEYCFPRAEPS